MRKLTAILLVFGLTGCVTQQMRWVRPGATQADFERDKIECVYESKKATGSMQAGVGMGGAIAAGIDQAMRESEIGGLCMRTKGWTQQRFEG